jgi:hypothetical protein
VLSSIVLALALLLIRWPVAISAGHTETTLQSSAALLVSPGAGAAPTKLIDGATLADLRAGSPFDATFNGGVRTAAGDLTGDGVADIAVAMASGGGLVRVFDGATMAEIQSGFPFGGDFSGGVALAMGDLDGDGRSDIVAGHASGGGTVRAFSGNDYQPLLAETPFGAAYAGGVNLAAGDLDGDGRADVVVAQATGAQISVISGVTRTVTATFAPYGPSAAGLFVAAGDVNGDGRADIVVAPASGQLPLLVYDLHTQLPIASFLPYGTASPGGVRVAAADLTGDGLAEVITAPGPGHAPELRVFAGATLALLSSRLIYPANHTAGTFVSATHADAVMLAAPPVAPPAAGGVEGVPPSTRSSVVLVNAWRPRRLGERRVMTATATDGSNPIATSFSWTSSNPSVIAVTVDGHAIALARGTATLTAQAMDSGTTGQLLVEADDTAVVPRPSSGGAMFTLWPARGGEQPVVVQRGAMRIVQDVFCPGESFGSESRLVPCPPGYSSVVDPVDLFAPWSNGAIAKLDWVGDLIGVLTDVGRDGVGTLRVLDRFEEWTLLALSDVRDFSIETVGLTDAYPRVYHLGIVHADGRVRVKDSLHGPWTTLVAANERQPRLVLAGNRIGVIFGDGEVRVKDGVHGGWTVLMAPGSEPSAVNLVLEHDRIGVVFSNGDVRVKDDGTGWTLLVDGSGGPGASELLLEGNRIAIRYRDGAVQAKDGIHGAWRRLVDGSAVPGVADLVLDGDRIGILRTDGVVVAKEGLDGPWHTLKSDVTAMTLQEGFVGVVTRTAGGDLVVQAKQSLTGPWGSAARVADAPVDQFLLIVDVPSKPFRGGAVADEPGNHFLQYAARQKLCGDEADCYPRLADGVPVDYYGWYCGRGSVNRQLLDPVDDLCRHHDQYQSRYELWGIGHLGVAQGCIVQAGAEKARLTDAAGNVVPYDLSDGASVARAFASIPRTGEALLYFWEWGWDGCFLEGLDDFLDATTSKR